jgi:AraC-like DNA-binding protein
MPVLLNYNLDLAPESRWNTISASSTAKASLIYVQETGQFLAGADYYTTREDFASYLIKMTVDGCGQLEYNSQTYLVPPGHFFWIDCRKKQHYRTAPDTDNWHSLWVHFYGANAKAYYDAFLTHNNGSPTGIFPVPSNAMQILTALLELDTAGQSQIMMDFQAASLIHQLLSECVLSTMTMGKASDMPEIIQGVRMHLLNHYREKHTLEELGNRFNINPYYLQKQFKRYVGMSPSEYMTRVRMRRACELLAMATLSVREVGDACGYPDQLYFSRVFRAHFGVPPSKYKPDTEDTSEL